MIRVIPRVETLITDGSHQLGPECFIPQRATDASAGYDVRAAIREPVCVQAQCTALVPLGFSLDMRDEPSMAAFLLPRSGLGHKRGLVLGNLVGVIDNDYQGEVMASVWNRNPTRSLDNNLWITPGMVLAQLVFLCLEAPTFQTMPTGWKPDSTGRGEGGFGSTGV